MQKKKHFSGAEHYLQWQLRSWRPECEQNIHESGHKVPHGVRHLVDPRGEGCSGGEDAERPDQGRLDRRKVGQDQVPEFLVSLR